jgi:hypothetical protein
MPSMTASLLGDVREVGVLEEGIAVECGEREPLMPQRGADVVECGTEGVSAWRRAGRLCRAAWAASTAMSSQVSCSTCESAKSANGIQHINQRACLQ